MALLARYLAAVDYVGAALTWSDESVAIHTVETLNPSRLDPWLLRWANDPRCVDPTAIDRVPPTALALASGHVHAMALLDALTQIVPEEDQIRLTNFETLLSGLLLGQDLRSRILPLVGPGILAYFDAPSEAGEPAAAPERKPAAAATWPFPAGDGDQPRRGFRAGPEPRDDTVDHELARRDRQRDAHRAGRAGDGRQTVRRGVRESRPVSSPARP